MFWLIVGILLIIAAAVSIFVAAGHEPRTSSSDIPIKGIAIALAFTFAIVGIFTIVWDSWTIIPAKNVGVVNTFGKANRAIENGAHWVWPWSTIEVVDATVQNLNRDQASNNCVTVRLANQTTACVDITLQWNIDQHANANELWARYRGTNDNVVGNVGHNVVERELQNALNRVFEKYNPLATLNGDGQSTVSTTDLAKQALASMQASVDKGIIIDTLLISMVHHDGVTQSKLDGYAQALADTRIAEQQKKTAEQQRLANEQLVIGTSSNDPGVKYQNCLNLIKDLAAKGKLQDLQYGGLMCSVGGNSIIVGK